MYSIFPDDPLIGLIARLHRPNPTGRNTFIGELGAKRLALLHELVPSTETIGFLENPNNPLFEIKTRDMLAAVPVGGPKVQILKQAPTVKSTPPS